MSVLVENLGLAIPVGVWDQVVEFGQYQHETVNGEPCLSIHDASTCKVMLDDFAAHPNCDIFYDKQHEVEPLLGEEALDRERMLEWGQGDGHALAWANAMCMVIGGQVVRYEPHPAAPATAPRADDVLLRSDGTRRGDGVFCLRSQVTPRGADPIEGLGNFRFTSPFYVPERDGNRLLNLTATNDPRMRGCALAFSRSGAIAMSRITQETPPARRAPGKEDPMDPKEMARLMEAAGCKAEDKPEDVAGKMAAYARKMEDESKKEKESSEMARKKMEDESAEMRRKMDETDPKGAAMRRKMDEEEKRMGRKMDDSERAKFEADHKEPDGDEGKAAMQSMQRRQAALEEKNAMLERELRENRSSMESLKKFEQGQHEKTATIWAGNALAMGRIKHDHKGGIEATVKWLTGKYLKDPADAEDLLSAEGTFGISEPSVMKRLTVAGAGIGQPMPRDDELAAAGSTVKAIDQQMNRAIAMQTQKLKAAGKPANYDAAVAEVKRTDRKTYDLYMKGAN